MKKIISVLKIALPLAFGVFLIWYVFKDLNEQERKELNTAMHQANYFWVLFSVSLGVLSHISRAYRWKYTIEPLGKTPGLWNSFFAVMIGYAANYALPRLGEVTRPGLLAKYEGLSFNKLFGTIVAERVADLIILAGILATIIFIEMDMLKDGLVEFMDMGAKQFSIQSIIILGSIIIVGIVIFIVVMLNKSTHPIFIKVRTLIRGVWEGVQSILKMEKKVYFLLHTAFIWLMYIGMFYTCFFSLEETSDVPFTAVMAAFVMGSLAIVFVQGGLGVFPLAIMETLILYGIAKPPALALGWLLWSSQTLMVIVLGVISIPLIRFINRNKKQIEVA